MESFILDQATHTLRSAAILFLRDRTGRKGLSLGCVFYSRNIDLCNGVKLYQSKYQDVNESLNSKFDLAN